MEDSKCSKCQQKGVSIKQIGTVILGFYILFSSIYGTKILIENIISLF